jgi:hypothetical protein
LNDSTIHQHVTHKRNCSTVLDSYILSNNTALNEPEGKRKRKRTKTKTNKTNTKKKRKKRKKKTKNKTKKRNALQLSGT